MGGRGSGAWQNGKSTTSAYRVLLTRARQGMAIFVLAGDLTDPTRSPKVYDESYAYLKLCGIHTH